MVKVTPETRDAVRVAALYSDDPIGEVARVLVVALDESDPIEAAWIRRTLHRLRRVDPLRDVEPDPYDQSDCWFLDVLRAVAREAVKAVNEPRSAPGIDRARDRVERAVSAMRALSDGRREWLLWADEYASELRIAEGRKAAGE